MTDLPPLTGAGADDAQLLERARAGDSDAFGELYEREVEAARRLARILAGNDRAEELVAESFARVLAQVKAGRGPTDDFRAYLHVTIRNGFRDALRATTEAPASDQPWLLDDVLPPVEELIEDLDRDVAVTALATLPKSWQQVLWHLEVEGRKPAEVATLLDLDAGAVSSLAYRAREGLKRAYLDQHLRPAIGGACGWTQSRMSQYVRGDLSARAEQKALLHIDGCADCTEAFATVGRVNEKLAAWIFPVVLWGLVGAEKGGLLWIVGAAGAGGAGATGTPINPPTPAPNPVVLGAAAAAAAAVVVGGLALALTAGDGGDRDRDTASSEVDGPGPGDAAPPPLADPDPSDQGSDAPSDVPSDRATTVAPVVTPTGPSTTAPSAVATSAPAVAGPTDEPTATQPTDPTGGPTDPTTTPTTEPPPVEVVPVGPVEADITTCGTDGSLTMATTTGVDYALTSGNGTTGPWTVTATARDGYVIAAGAPAVFAGDLGTYYSCIDLVEVDARRNGPPLITPWEIGATVAVHGARPVLVEVELDFDQLTFLTGKAGAGWTCDGIVTLLNPFDGPVSCRYDYTGSTPAEVVLDVIALTPDVNDPPAGSVTVFSNGHQVDVASIS